MSASPAGEGTTSGCVITTDAPGIAGTIYPAAVTPSPPPPQGHTSTCVGRGAAPWSTVTGEAAGVGSSSSESVPGSTSGATPNCGKIKLSKSPPAYPPPPPPNDCSRSGGKAAASADTAEARITDTSSPLMSIDTGNNGGRQSNTSAPALLREDRRIHDPDGPPAPDRASGRSK